MLAFIPSAAVWSATPPAIARRDRLVEAMRRTNVKQSVAAHYMKISEQQLSDQLALRQPLNWFRLCDLFEAIPELEDEYSKLGLEIRGWRVWRDAVLNNLVDSFQESIGLVRELAGRRRMLKAALPPCAAERKRA